MVPYAINENSKFELVQADENDDDTIKNLTQFLLGISDCIHDTQIPIIENKLSFDCEMIKGKKSTFNLFQKFSQENSLNFKDDMLSDRVKNNLPFNAL